jgi:hypothetical protein
MILVCCLSIPDFPLFLDHALAGRRAAREIDKRYLAGSVALQSSHGALH